LRVDGVKPESPAWPVRVIRHQEDVAMDHPDGFRFQERTA
jgi:hypothetical protein